MNLLFSIFLFLNISGETRGQVEQQYTNLSPVTHTQWNDLLSKNVSVGGKVNYKGFLQEKQKLENYLKLLGSTYPNDNWQKKEQLAYWINAYNAFTVKLIIDHYPVKSIKEIGGAIKSPWDIDFIVLAGKKFTLNKIEHEILRKKFDEPRIHFAIVCASFSCPKLLNEAYTAVQLDKQLDKQAKAFINNQDENKISANKVELSSLFNWFRGDFTKNGTLLQFINKYAVVKINEDAKIEFLQYNWSLNE